MLTTYVVIYRQHNFLPFTFDCFVCMAEDMEHAEEQANNSCPDCDILGVEQTENVNVAVANWLNS